jgi:hypothetical protein
VLGWVRSACLLRARLSNIKVQLPLPLKAPLEMWLPEVFSQHFKAPGQAVLVWPLSMEPYRLGVA